VLIIHNNGCKPEVKSSCLVQAGSSFWFMSTHTTSTCLLYCQPGKTELYHVAACWCSSSSQAQRLGAHHHGNCSLSLSPHKLCLLLLQAQRLGADFYMNEAFIHESQAGDPSAARTCGEFRSLGRSRCHECCFICLVLGRALSVWVAGGALSVWVAGGALSVP
jgi:hypothetical protein